MIIRYKKRDGSPAEVSLTEKSITLGRSPDADIIILDERASRMHARVRYHEGAHYIKDLESRNGTYVNGSKIDLHELKAGDKIRLGKSEFLIGAAESADPSKVAKVAVAAATKTPGTETVNREIAGKLEEGKGLKTIMREIVEEVEKPAAAPVGSAAGLVEAVEENEFADPGELGNKNLTMDIGDMGDLAEDDAKPSDGKPRLQAKKPMLKAKTKLEPKAAKESDGDEPVRPQVKLGTNTEADADTPVSPLKKRPTLKLKKPGS